MCVMTKVPLPLVTFVSILAISASCGGERGAPTAPTAPSPPSLAQPAGPAENPTAFVPSFPAVAQAARIYVAARTTFYPYHGSPLASRYVLYEDGKFALQYSSANYPFFEYRGTYTQTGTNLVFDWEGWSVAGPWAATGEVSDETLKVAYNIIMQLSDFEDGVYLRAN